MIIHKATAPEKEAYSVFQDTPLDIRLRETDVRRVFIGGLATEYCVLNTVTDAINLGYTVFLLLDAIRAVNLQPADGKKAEGEMVRLGASPIRVESLQE